MINPSDIKLSSLPWLPLDAKTAFPKNPTIYFAIDSQDKIQYIGRSQNPKTRWANHHKYDELQAIGGIKIAYLFVDSCELLPEIESALISWFDPPLNVLNKSAASGFNSNFIVQKYGEVISRLRSDAGLTQKQVADKLNMTVQTISNWENNLRTPKLTPKQTLILCKTLNCSLEQLAGELHKKI